MVQEKDERRLDPIALEAVAISDDGARVLHVVRIVRPEAAGGVRIRVVGPHVHPFHSRHRWVRLAADRVLLRQFGRRMIRLGDERDVLHEGAAIAGFAVPPLIQQIASAKRPRQVMAERHVETVSHAVQALEQHPFLRRIGVVGLARTADDRRVVGAVQLEIRLHHPVVAPGGELDRAMREGGRHVGVHLVAVNADPVRVHVHVPLHIGVGPDEGAQGLQGSLHAARRDPVDQEHAVARHLRALGRLGRAARGIGPE